MPAKTKKEVEQQSAKDRLWDSLDYSYGQQREASDKAYDQARSQADRQAQSRGMQRSSYNGQTLANIDNQKIKAQNDIYNAQIADYQNRLTNIEQQEKEEDRWERQFAENQRQYNEQMAYNRERASVADTQWQTQYDANRSDTAWNQAFQQQQYDANRSDTAWNQAFQREQYDASRADTAWNQSFQQQQYADSRSDTAWNQAFQREQYDANRSDTAWNQAFQQQQYADSRSDVDWQRAFQQQQYSDSRSDTAWQQNFSEQQWQAQQAQWREEFDYNKKTNDQKIAFEVITNAVANGKDVTDDILARAGISREDYNAMKKQVSGGGPGKKKNPWDLLGMTEEEYNRLIGNTGGNETGNNTENFLQGLFGETGGGKDRIRNDTSGAGRPENSNGLFSQLNERLKKTN